MKYYREARLQAIVDAINRVYGHDTLIFAIQGGSDSKLENAPAQAVWPLYNSLG
jgi:hypothetical protein